MCLLASSRYKNARSNSESHLSQVTTQHMLPHWASCHTARVATLRHARVATLHVLPQCACCHTGFVATLYVLLQCTCCHTVLHNYLKRCEVPTIARWCHQTRTRNSRYRQGSRRHKKQVGCVPVVLVSALHCLA